MRTIPQSIIDGMVNRYKKGFFIIVQTETENYYFQTSRNIIMSGESELPGVYDRIAILIDNKIVEGIGKIKKGMNLDNGCGNVHNTEMKIKFLNQDRYDLAIDEFVWENSRILIYMYYYISDEVLDKNNFLLIFDGIIDSLKKEDLKSIEISCVKKSKVIEKLIPEKTINEKDYPYAHKDIIGNTISVVYGNFILGDIYVADHSGYVKAQCIDDYTRKYLVAGHDINTFTPLSNLIAFVEMRGINELGYMGNNYTVTHSGTETYITISEPIWVQLILKPWKCGTQMSAAITSSYHAAVDLDTDTKLALTTGKLFYVKIEELQDIGKLKAIAGAYNVFVYINFGTVVNGGSGKAGRVRYYYNSAWIDLDWIYATASNITGLWGGYTATDEWEFLSRAEFGITVEAGGSIEIKNFRVFLCVYPR